MVHDQEVGTEPSFSLLKIITSVVGFAVFPQAKVLLPAHILPYRGERFERQVSSDSCWRFLNPVENGLELAVFLRLGEQPRLARTLEPS